MYFGRNKGSLAVTLSGEHTGKWTDKEALEEAARLVNYIPGEFKQELDKRIKKITHKDELNCIQKLSIKKAQKLVSESRDIKDTPAEKYLKEARSIDLKDWPKNLKYHDGVYSQINKAKHPALLVIACDKDDKIQSVQAIYLDKETAQKANVKIPKQTFGPIKGALFSANMGLKNNKTAVICEGPEDALSILKSTTGKDIYACLGKSNFHNLNQEKLANYDKIILALDNDGKKPGEMSDVLTIASKLHDSGKEVLFAQPDRVKQDYNDILKADGGKAVEAILAKSQSFDNAQFGKQVKSGKEAKSDNEVKSGNDIKIDKSNDKVMEKEM